MENTDEKVKLLGQFHIQIKRSEIAHKNYMANGKKFIFTKIIKKCNEEILRLLLTNPHLLTGSLLEDSLQLIAHIDIWSEKWDDLQQRNQPGLEDEFVFENKFNFPRDAAQRIEAEFLSLQNIKQP